MNEIRLFYGSCFALITTAFSFSIQAGILGDLGADFGLSTIQLGWFNRMWFLGFPISMVLGGLFYNIIGPKLIMQFAFLAHTTGIVLTVYAGGYLGLLIATLLIGFGNGCTEAACNPIIADAFQGNKMNRLMNRFHLWFPGGIFLGSIISYFMDDQWNFSWQSQIWIILIPTLIYAYLFWGQTFPKPRVSGKGSSLTITKSIFSPLFIFMLICMFFTANAEFGPTRWIEVVLSGSGAKPMLILAVVTGVMALGRFFGGNLVAKFDQTGVFLISSILGVVGIYLFTTFSGAMLYAAAVIFALGICYYWPNMIGFVAEKIPKSGALGLSIVGATGMVATASIQPLIGKWIIASESEGRASGLEGTALEVFTGRETLEYMMWFPIILIVLFAILFFVQRRSSTI